MQNILNKIDRQPINKKFQNFITSFLIISTLMWTWCDNKKNRTVSNVKPITTENIDIKQEYNVETPREYKIQHLNINSVVDVKWDLQRAKVKVQKTPLLKQHLNSSDFVPEKILPMIIKESNMNNNNVSKTWAVWYGQIKQTAYIDLVEKYPWLDLDRNDPVDNLILCALYRKRATELVKSKINKDNYKNLSDDDYFQLTILSYNAGPDRIWRLFNDYCEKNKISNMDWFIQFLRKLIWVNWKIKREQDEIYHIQYDDYLWWYDLNYFDNNEQHKIAESLRYLSIINGLSSYISEDNTIVIIWTIICTKDNTLYSQIKWLKDSGLFKPTANINDICNTIMECNWVKDSGIPEWATLFLPKNDLISFLSNE